MRLCSPPIVLHLPLAAENKAHSPLTPHFPHLSLPLPPFFTHTPRQAYSLLKPGGYIAVSDFTVTPSHSLLTRIFWPAVLGLDGVRPSTEHIAYLDSKFQRMHCLVEKGGFPYMGEMLLAGGAALGAGASYLLSTRGVPAALEGLLGAALPSTYGLALAAWALGASAALCTLACALALFCLVSYFFLDGEELALPFVLSSTLVAGVNALWYFGGIVWSAGHLEGFGGAWRWYHALTRLDAIPGVYAYHAAVADAGAAVPALGGLSVAGLVPVPSWAVFTIVGAALGYAASALIKAPYYSYVARKKLA